MSALPTFTPDDETVRLEKGQTVFREGDRGDAMYVVLDGEIEICHKDRVIEVIGQHGIFGEMALVDDAPRSATAIARESATLTRITRERFEFLIQYSPTFATEVMRVMATRLRAQMDL